MEKNIFNVYVEMDSQATCDRMKQLCVDNGLKTFDEPDFNYRGNLKINSFQTMAGIFDVYYDNKWDNIQVTETEFIELLKQYKNE